MEDISFIILRHVNNEESNKYWNICLDRILNYYPDNLIVIIDDNSKIEPKRLGSNPKKIITINSEFPPQRGEFLPYYYINKNKFAKVNIILHDTVFLHKKIEDKFLQTDTFHFLWEFKINKNYPGVTNYIKEIIKKFNNYEEIIKFYENDKNWNGCFGGMSIINYNYLNKVFTKSNYVNILKKNINNRKKRMAFERIIAILLIYYDKINEPVNGDIHENLKWGISYTKYLEKKNYKPMEKIWVGRENILIEPFSQNIKKYNYKLDFLIIILLVLILII